MDIFLYSNYRKFLQDWLLKVKKERRFSATALADLLGIHPTFLSQVLKGNKDLSLDHWVTFIEHLNVSEIEKDYLHSLILENRAGTESSKKFYRKKRDEILKRRLQLKERMQEYRELTDVERSVFYSSWIYSGMRLSCSIDSGKSLEELAHIFGQTMAKAEEIMNFLVTAGLCKIEKNKYQLGEKHIHTPASSPFTIRHHTNWRLRAIESLDHAREDELHFTAPMTISMSDFSLIREKMVKLIQESISIAKESEAKELVTMNLDFFFSLPKK